MKKQLFILFLAIFAITLSGYTQNPVPRPADCIDLTNPLTVVPGQPYTYEVNVPTPDGDKSYRWLVTQDETFIDATGIIATPELIPASTIIATTDTWYNVDQGITAGVTNPETMRITWKSFDLDPDEYVFIVIQVTNTAVPGGCNTKNTKVYRVQPLHAFTLDIANIQADGTILGADYGTNINQCVSDIASAVYDATNDEVDYDFGMNTFHYAVTAANFSGDWQLRVELLNLQPGETADIYWGYTFNSRTNTIATAWDGTDIASVDPVEIQDGLSSVGSAGQTIFITIDIHHGNTFEALVLHQYDFAVNGNLLSDTGTVLADKADISQTTATCEQIDFDDVAYQSVTPRPDIESVNPAPGTNGYLDGWLPIGN